jgi:MFS family permease
MSEYRSVRAIWARLWLSSLKITAGGGWSSQLPAADQRNLRWFFFDGVLAAAGDAISVTYILLFVLALGATPAQIGLLSALGSLSATLLLIPGAVLSERTGKRKRIVLSGGGGITRLALLMLACVPLVFHGQGAIYVAILVKVIADGFANFSLPAWTSITADIVPLSSRGRYFGTRNVVMGSVGMLITYLAGVVITRLGAPLGYQVMLVMAFLIGAGSTFCYSRIREPATPPQPTSLARHTPAALWRIVRADRSFLALCLYNLAWNFSLSIAGPFFNVYLVRDLKATAAMVGVLSIVTSLSGLPAQRVFGLLNDRWGSYRVQLLTGLLIPLLPFAWIFTRQPWHAIPINIVAGVLWAGFSLAAFNLLLEMSPPEQRAMYPAIYQMTVAISAAVGASLGGLVATQWGIPVVFAISAGGRLLSMIVFYRFVHPPKRMTVER